MFELDPMQKFYQERGHKRLLERLEEERKRRLEKCIESLKERFGHGSGLQRCNETSTCKDDC